MKNILIIDEAPNCAYDIFAVEENLFKLIFPSEGQNIEFIEDVLARLNQDEIDGIYANFKTHPVAKDKVNGINGILFLELKNQKSKFYPNKKDSDLDGWARGWISDPNAPAVNTPEFMASLFTDG